MAVLRGVFVCVGLRPRNDFDVIAHYARSPRTSATISATAASTSLLCNGFLDT
jgi:hypothetical protein